MASATMPRIRADQLVYAAVYAALVVPCEGKWLPVRVEPDYLVGHIAPM
jgi:hypothetical protein